MASDTQRLAHLKRLARIQDLKIAQSEAALVERKRQQESASQRDAQIREDLSQETAKLIKLHKAERLDLEAMHIRAAFLLHFQRLANESGQQLETRTRAAADAHDRYSNEREVERLTASKVEQLSRKMARKSDEKATEEQNALFLSREWTPTS